VWLRSGDRLELDGIGSDLETMLRRARSVGRARVRATGDARAGWVSKVINALRTAQVTVLTDPSLSQADYVRELLEATSLRPTGELRNAGVRPSNKLPRYDARRGLWKGGDSRTLYTFANPDTGRMWVVPGGHEMLSGPQATVRVSTRDEAEELWQRPLHSGWQVATTEPRRNAAGEPSHIAVLRRVANEQFASMQRGAVVSTSSSIQGAMASAPPKGDVAIRGEYTSDGTHWGVGRGRLVASRANGRWALG
jgi:hypothetical protein